MEISNNRRTLLILVLLFTVYGCSTISTLSLPAYERKPLVMSGARLDIAALRKDKRITEKFGVSSPAYPALDLPLSAFFDFLVLGYTVPAAIYYSH